MESYDDSVNAFWNRIMDNGRVTKKTYIPVSLCVIEIRADMGSFILNKLIFTGLSTIFWDICLLISRSYN